MRKANTAVAEMFRKRLAALCGNESQTDIAQKIGISNSTISYCLSGSRVPDLIVLEKICSAFGCSADYLIGLPAEDFDMTDRLASDVTGLSVKAIGRLKGSPELAGIVNRILEEGSAMVIFGGERVKID